MNPLFTPPQNLHIPQTFQLNKTTGFLLHKLPQILLKEIDSEVNLTQSLFKDEDLLDSYLAGAIDKEYKFKVSNNFSNYLQALSTEFNKNIPSYFAQASAPFQKEDLQISLQNRFSWINFQKKYEYNPIHLHSGLFSYVLWYKLPFTHEDEHFIGPGNPKNKPLNINSPIQNDISKHGSFNFIYSSGGDEVETQEIIVDNKWEGIIALFPSSLKHFVNPFYSSDDYRITISGNIFINSIS